MSETVRISLAAARVNAGMSQDQVASALHVSKQTVCSWENYKTTPSVDMAERIAELFCLPMNCIKFTK